MIVNFIMYINELIEKLKRNNLYQNFYIMTLIVGIFYYLLKLYSLYWNFDLLIETKQINFDFLFIYSMIFDLLILICPILLFKRKMIGWFSCIIYFSDLLFGKFSCLCLNIINNSYNDTFMGGIFAPSLFADVVMIIIPTTFLFFLYLKQTQTKLNITIENNKKSYLLIIAIFVIRIIIFSIYIFPLIQKY